MGRSIGNETRKRSTSGGSFKEMTSSASMRTATSTAATMAISQQQQQQQDTAMEATLLWWEALVQWRDCRGKSILHTYAQADSARFLAHVAALLDRTLQLDQLQQQLNNPLTATSTSSSSSRAKGKHAATNTAASPFRRRLLLIKDAESGSTPFHDAILHAHLPVLLLLLRHALYDDATAWTAIQSHGSIDEQRSLKNKDPNQHGMQSNSNATKNDRRQQLYQHYYPSQRLTHRPMDLLHQYHAQQQPNQQQQSLTSSSSLLSAMLSATDGNGLTPPALMAILQRSELQTCRQHLYRPRIRLQRPTSSSALFSNQASAQQPQRQRHRQQSWDERDVSDDDDPWLEGGDNEQNEFDVLSHGLAYLQRHTGHQLRPLQPSTSEEDGNDSGRTTYGYEVVTFGRAHHCALGVVTGSESTSTTATTPSTSGGLFASSVNSYSGSVTSSTTPLSTKFRPQRVQAFAQDRVDRGRRDNNHQGNGGAVGIAASTHHTLVVTAAGHVYAFGLGKGGRLGTGSEAHCPLPTRIHGPLTKRFVITVAAAENHSLCVTRDGTVYAWGSNRFGQLGIPTTNNNPLPTENSCAGGINPSSQQQQLQQQRCFLPRRVDDLKQVPCVAVAAGDKHSVALSRFGEVYVWGDNSAGQLGHSRRNGLHKVQRVESLWTYGSFSVGTTTVSSASASASSGTPKVAAAVAASSQTTMVLIIPAVASMPASSGLTLPTSSGNFAVNSIYTWGNGSHVPTKVHLQAGEQTQQQQEQDDYYHLSAIHPINPVAIACARYHCVATTADGKVYTWGLHAEPLGTGSAGAKAKRPISASVSPASTKPVSCGRRMATPQLVAGMLPERGGGLAVAVSASEHHTAVITDTGALYTWGATDGTNILGHEGVRWQPDPRRVPGVHRAVAVAAAKEHFVLLIGASFPPIVRPEPTPQISPYRNPSESSSLLASSPVASLEIMCALSIAQHVDLFNVMPILITAERTQCKWLSDYCQAFIRRNLDGVLNVAQKSDLDCYLNEQLFDCRISGNSSTVDDDDDRDQRFHPMIQKFLLAGCNINNKCGQPVGSSGVLHGGSVLCSVDQWMRACQDLLIQRDPQVIHLMERYAMSQFDLGLVQPRHLAPSFCVSAADRRKHRSVSFSESETLVGSTCGNNKTDDSSGCSSRCRDLTTGMDLSSRDRVEAHLAVLSKEMRNVRKRLSQIFKLQEVDDMASTTNKVIQLTKEQQSKIARRSQLEADLLVFGPAIEIVEQRLKELTISEETIVKANELDDVQAVKKLFEKKNDVEPSAELEGSNQANVGTLWCATCKITCPDEKSYELHINGRKHRNKVVQDADLQAKRVAETMIAQKQRQAFLDRDNERKQDTGTPVKTNNAWSKHSSTTALMNFNLPPPPHPVPDSMAKPKNPSAPSLDAQVSSSKSFLDIMEEEKVRSGSASKKAPVKAKPKQQHHQSLKLPPGSAPAMKSPPWSTTSAVQVDIASSPAHDIQRETKVQMAPTATMKSPVWASAPPTTPRTTRLAEVITSPANQSSSGVDKDMLLLSSAAEPMLVTQHVFGESCSSVVVPNQDTPSALRFVDIQEQEMDFKTKQDLAFGVNTKWFIERRERAGSFRDIQTSAVKERDERLFIEEQFRIEKQIMDDIAAQKKNAIEKQMKKAADKKKKKQNRKGKPHASGGPQGGGGGDDKGQRLGSEKGPIS